MNLLVKGIIIVDPNSDFNQQTCDVRVEHGNIVAIEDKLETKNGEEVFKANGAILSPGFFDLNCAIGDPGLETKEDIQTGTAAAMAGGFTGIAVLPTTNPVVQSKGEIAYILNKAKNNLVDVYVQKVKQSWLGKVGFCSFEFDTFTRQYRSLNQPKTNNLIPVDLANRNFEPNKGEEPF